jgi:type I restriction enzyme R subunit
MRQAIEEGFILDVLRNYTTYKTYYRLVQARAEHDPDVDRREATKALARFMSLHPHNIAQKTEVILEHYRRTVRPQLQGQAKGMVVTRSRLHAVRYKAAFDAYLREHGYSDLRALVAFSGTVLDPDDGSEHTEVKMNGGIPEGQLPERFASDDYQVLIAANKYQTGFDQPLLTAMYVDKRLSGVQAVQTLSRLNRTHPGKTETFVLDFVNEATDIQAAFQPYYEQTTVSERADPYQLEQLQHALDAARIWTIEELEGFAKVFYRKRQQLTEREHATLHARLQPAVDRYAAWDDAEAREAWRGQLQDFTRLYAFLSQVMPWSDRDLEIRYTFGRFLLRRLPVEDGDPLDLDGEVDLHAYRLARIAETDIPLQPGETGEVPGPTQVGTGRADDEQVPLHEIIETLNERFGTDFTKADQLFFDAVTQDGEADAEVQARARANTYENFHLSVKERLEHLIIDRMDRNQSIVTRLLNDGDLRQAAIDLMARKMYDDLRMPGS